MISSWSSLLVLCPTPISRQIELRRAERATTIGTPDSYWNLRRKKSLERGQRRRLAARERTCYECTSARGSRADAGRRRRPAAMNVPPGLGGQDRCAA